MYTNFFFILCSFNVHEKLQNFMAPVPVGTWHEAMVEELYTSLLGQKLGGDSLDE